VSDENPNLLVLIADDDEDDRLMIKDAFADSGLANPLVFVQNGEDLMNYLKHTEKYSGLIEAQRPALILLDLNMPKKNGREALAEIKNDQTLKTIPVVVLTTSNSREEINRIYGLGANSFIVKPCSFDLLINIIKTLKQYWFDVNELPSRNNPD
jgi:CheY-like chemotaxis protein